MTTPTKTALATPEPASRRPAAAQSWLDRAVLRTWATAQSRRRHHLQQIAAAKGRDKPWKAAAWVIAEWRALSSAEQREQVVEALVRLAEELNGRWRP